MGEEDHNFTPDDKFVVMKAEDWDRYYRSLIQVCDQSGVENARNIFINPPIVKDAVVIRTRDIFAEQGLMAYAGVVQTAIELADQLSFKIICGVPVTRLREIADYFHDRAQEAHEILNKRVPD